MGIGLSVILKILLLRLVVSGLYTGMMDSDLKRTSGVTLAMIARDDPKGLRRAILSALPYCEKVVVGVDSRSKYDLTQKVAEELADLWFAFDHVELGMSEADWKDDKIDFAAARNAVLSRVKTPWVLTIDTDEHIVGGNPDNLASILSAHRGSGCDAIPVLLEEYEYTTLNSSRLARSDLRWERSTHNELPTKKRASVPCGIHIKQDRSHRSKEETERRDRQRARAMEEMHASGDHSDPWVLFHVAKDVLAKDKLSEGRRYVRRYLEQTEGQFKYKEGRSFLKVALSAAFLRAEKFEDARFWATEALHEGPRIEAFGMLGTLSELQGRDYEALAWFQAESSCPQIWHMRWPEIVRTRIERRDKLLRRVFMRAAGPQPGS